MKGKTIEWMDRVSKAYCCWPTMVFRPLLDVMVLGSEPRKAGLTKWMGEPLASASGAAPLELDGTGFGQACIAVLDH